MNPFEKQSNLTKVKIISDFKFYLCLFIDSRNDSVLEAIKPGKPEEKEDRDTWPSLIQTEKEERKSWKK